MALIAALFLLLPARAYAATEALMEWASAFDPARDEGLPQPGLTDLPSYLGPMVDRSCRWSPEDPAKAKKLAHDFEATVDKAFSGVRSCSEDFPRLVVLSRAVSVMRRMTWACTSSELDPAFRGKKGVRAYSKRGRSGAWRLILPDSLRKFVDLQDDIPSSAFIHQALRIAMAGQKTPRSRLAGVPQDPAHPCYPNYLDDRLRLVEALCGFDPTIEGETRSSTEMLYRVRQCGLERACVRPFSRAIVPGERPDKAFWTARDALAFCGGVEDVLARLSDEAKGMLRISDSFKKYRIALRYFELEAGGLGNGVPYYYLKAVPKDTAKALSAMKDLGETISSQCGPLDKLIRVEEDRFSAYLRPPAGDVQNVTHLLPFDPRKAQESCPLSAANPAFEQTAALADFHDREQALQAGSLKILGELYDSVEGRSDPIEDVHQDLKNEVKVLYEPSCPTKPGAFRPFLCAKGEKALTDAIEEARARVGGRR